MWVTKSEHGGHDGTRLGRLSKKNWESNPATEQFAQSVFEQLQQLTQLDGIKVLDFGCGTGQLSQRLSPMVKDIVALDASEAMIEELDKKKSSST